MSTKNYSESFIGFVPSTKAGTSQINRIKDTLRGTKFRLALHGRNPDRKQFYKHEKPVRSSFDGTIIKHSFCQDLPLKFAKTIALYVREKNRDYDLSYEQSRREVITTVKKARKLLKGKV